MSETKIINQCIYCLSEDNLSDEHALPYSMNGDIILGKASCPSCQKKINSEVENKINSIFYKSARSFLRLKSRSKNYINKIFIAKDKEECEFNLKDFGTIIDFPVIDTDTPEICNSIISFHLRNEPNKIPPGEYTFTTNFEYSIFLRYLVKIAYSLLIYSQGITHYNEKVTSFILGRTKSSPRIKTTNISTEFSTKKITPKDRINLHKITYRVSTDKKTHFFVISFFDFLGGPKYIVEINEK